MSVIIIGLSPREYKSLDLFDKQNRLNFPFGVGTRLNFQS